MNKFFAIIALVLLFVIIICYPAVMKEALFSKIKYSFRKVLNKI